MNRRKAIFGIGLAAAAPITAASANPDKPAKLPLAKDGRVIDADDWNNLVRVVNRLNGYGDDPA